MREEIINRGKDWWEFRKGMKDFVIQTKNMDKKRTKTKTRALPNNTMPAPHSLAKVNYIGRV